MFLLLVLTTATQSATAAQLTPGRSPFSIGAGILSSWWRTAHQWADESTVSLPLQERGSGSAAHSTKAHAGSGRAPGKGAGQLPLAGSQTSHAGVGKSSTITRGFNAKTSKRLPAKSSAYATWWQNADGTMTQQVSQSVVNYQDSSDDWEPIDTTLKKGADGRWQVSAAGYGLSLASGAAAGTASAEDSAFALGSSAFSTPLAASDLGADRAASQSASASAADTDSSTGTLATLTVATGESVSWALEGAASVTGSESGDTVTYPSILPDTDLSLSSEASGVKESLVLDSASAPSSWTFPLTLTGLTLSQASDGTWELVDGSGDVAATLADPFALDSSETAAAETQDVSYSVATVDGVEQLTMTLAQSWLDDPSRVFPVTVDPTITVSTAGSSLSSSVDDQYPTKNFSDSNALDVGNDGTGVNRAYINFPPSVISSDLQKTGYHITSAQFAAYMASGSTSSSYPFNVYAVADSWSASSITWNSAPANAYSELGTYAGSTSSAATCTGLNSGYWLYTPLSASAMEPFALDQETWEGIAVEAGNESSTSYYRVFGSASNASCSPYLSLTYTPDVAPTVSTMSPAGGSVVNSLTTELTASGTDADDWPDSSVEYEFEVFDAGQDTMIAHSSLQLSESWTIPEDTLKWGQTYQWSVCVFDGYECETTPTYNTFETSTPGPVLGQNLSQSTSGHGFDVATGNYTTSATDANIAGVGPALNVVRDYNSLDTRASGGFGAGWSSMIDATARQELDASGNLIGVAVTYPDGSVVVYGYNSGDGSYSPPEGRFATLLPITSSGSVVGYTLTDKNSTTYTFGTVVTAPVAGSGTAVYTTAGVFGISEVADVAGRSLGFTWGVTNNVAGSHVLVETNSISGRSLYFTWTTPSGAAYPHVSSVTTSYATSGVSSTAQYWGYGYTGDQLTSVCAPNPEASASPSTACTTYSYTLGSDYQQAVLDTAPYQYWPMDDVASDSSSLSLVSANIGLGRAYYTGMTADTTGPMTKIGSGATGGVFNGSSSFMTLPSGMVLNSTYVSVGLWFKTTSSGPLFSEQNENITESPTNATMSLYVGTDGYLHGGWYTGVNGSSGQIEDTKAKVTDGAWHYVVLSGAGSTQTMYVDGSSVGSLSGTIKNIGQTYEYVGAGYSSDTWPDQAAAGNWYFKGSISDVSVYKSALSSTEVTSLDQIATTSSNWLTASTRPRKEDGIASDEANEEPSASVAYNAVDGRVKSVTDGNGGTWGLSDPTVTGSSQVFRETVMGDRPAFYYRMADASGTYATDEVNADAWANQGLAATYSDVTLGSAQNVFSDATAATFDGANSYVTMPNSLTAAAPVSIALWFNATKNTSGPLWTEQDTGISGTPSAATNELYVGTNGLLYGSFDMGSQTPIASKEAVDDGQWHYVVLTASATSESLYLDGTLMGTETGTYQYASQSVGLIGAGYSSGDWTNQDVKGNWYFTGSISDAAFFYSQLSQDQVTQLWQAYHSSIGSIIPLVSVTVTDPADSFDHDVYQDTYEFDPAHAMREVKYVNGYTGGATTYSYDTDGYQDVVTDPNGDQTITGHDVRGNVVSTTTCQYQALDECSTSYKTYYPDDTTASFNASTMDPRDDLVTSSSDGRSSSASDTTYRTTYGYDKYGNLTSQTDPAGNGVTNVYTSADSQYACDPTSSTSVTLSTTQYEPLDLLSTSTTTGGAVTTYWYYPDGDTCMVQDPDNLRTYYFYDGLGRVVKKVVEGGDDILANMVGYTGVLTTTYVYDGQGRVIETTDPTVTDRVTGASHTAVTKYVYDADGDVTSVTVSDSTGGDYSRTTTYVYNGYDQKISETTPNGNQSTDMNGDVLAGASGHTESFTYDAWGNVEQQTDELTGTATRTVQTLYDAADRLRVTQLLNTSQNGTYSSGSVLTTDTKTYDAGGRLSSDEDALGNYTCYYYYDNNLLYQEIKTSESCPASSFTSSEQGDVTDTQIVSTSFYDGAGDVVKKYTNNNVTETDTTYNPDGTVASTILDPSGVDRITGYTYTQDGEVAETLVESDAGGVLSQVSDVKQTYDGLGNVMTRTVVDGSNSYETIYTLDQRGLPTQVEDPDGNITQTTYDEDGRLVETVSPSVPVTLWCQTATSYPLCTTAGTSVTFDSPVVDTVGYDTFGDEVESEGPDSPSAGTTPSGSNMATEAEAAKASSTVATYDAEGNETSVTLPTYTAPGASSPTTSTATYQYDSDGELLTETDPIGVASSNAEGEQVSYSYTMLGTVASQTDTDLATPANTGTTTYTYDADGQKLSTIAAISSNRSEATCATYDYLGRTVTSSTTESDPTCSTTTSNGSAYTTIDTYGKGGWLATSKSPDGDTASYGYDNVGEKTSSTNDLGQTTGYGYDGAGRLTTTTAPDQSSSQVVYDEAGNKVSTATYSAAGVQLTGTTMAYDGDGLLKSTTTQDPNQTAYNSANTESTTYTYDATGLLIKEVAPLSGSSTVPISYTYDLAGNKTGYTSGNGNTTYWTYNAWNLPETEIAPATSSDTTLASRETTTTYDADGRTIRVSEPVAGSSSTPITISSSYDGLGDLTSETSTGAEGANTTRTFSYDLTGLMLSASTANAQGTELTNENYTYNDRGDLTGTSGTAAGSSSFAYNGDNLMTTRTDASGTSNYTYNDDDQLTNLSDAATGTDLGYTYNTDGQVSEISYGTGDTRSFGYNAAHEVDSDTLATSGGTTVAALAYSWDTDGDLLSKTDSSGTSNTYGYDAAGRLSTWSNGTSTTKYSYDADSNRTGITTTTTVSGTVTSNETLTYDARDELTGTTNSVTTASASYTYTPRGTTSQISTVSSTGATGTTSYADDAFGQQTSAGQASYTYDALGRLISTTTGSTTTTLQYSGTGNDLASDGTNTYSRDPAGDLIGTADASADTSALLWTDQHTDVVAEFAANGTSLSGTETYSPLGQVTSATGTASALTIGYQSEWTDATTGDVNMAARWYSPSTGQFTSTDTVENSAVPNTANANPFAYADGNPLDGTDSTGHFGNMFSVYHDGVSVTGSMQYVSQTIETLDFNQSVINAVPKATVEQLVAADQAFQRAQIDAHSVADAEAKPIEIGTSHLMASPGGTIGSMSYLDIHYAQAQLAQDEATIDDLISQFTKADASNDTTCNGDPLTWGGCVHDAATWVNNNPIVKDVVSAAAGVIVGGACLVATAGAGSVGCAALGGAAASGLSYAITADATGHGSLVGFAESLALGAVAGASSAFAAGAVGGVVAGAFGEGTAAAAASGAATGFAAGAVGGAVGGGGGYLADCGPDCSMSGFAGAAAKGALYGGAGGGAAGAVVGLVAGDDGVDGVDGCVTAHSFTGDTGVLLADGSVVPIDQIKVGDEVENSAPGKAGTQVHKVDAVIVTHTDHDFVDVTVRPAATAGKAAGGKLARLAKTAVGLAAAAAVLAGAHAPASTGAPAPQAKTVGQTAAAAPTAGASTVTTTFHHPFYDATQGAFVQAQYLKPGDQLQTPTGTVRITAIRLYHANTTTYDLTIGELHTFYVLAGSTPVLVHNCGNGDVYDAGGSVLYHALDGEGRATGVSASITPDMLDTGTAANRDLDPSGWSGNGTLYNEARGHLLADRLGGSGDLYQNLVTLTQDPTNSPIMRDEIEGAVYDAVNNGETVQYSVRAVYASEGDVAPVGLQINAYGNRGFVLERYLENPAGMFPFEDGGP